MPLDPTRLRLSLAPMLALLGLLALAPEAAAELRVVTYNVKEGSALADETRLTGRAREKALRRARSLERQVLRDVDVLGLQELCTSDGGWQVRYFERRFRAVAGVAHVAVGRVDPDARSGCLRAQVLYSRYPIIASGVVQLPQARQPRSAVWADIVVPSRDGKDTHLVRVYNAHLENRTGPLPGGEGARHLQAKALLAHIASWQAERPDSPVILQGDLNTSGQIWNFWHRESAIREIEQQGFTSATRRRVQTLTMLPHQVDWIFARGLRRRAVHVPQLVLSDHYPLIADYELPSRSAGPASHPHVLLEASHDDLRDARNLLLGGGRIDGRGRSGP